MDRVRVSPIPSRRDGEAPKHRTVVARFCRFCDRQQALRNSPKLRNKRLLERGHVFCFSIGKESPSDGTT